MARLLQRQTPPPARPDADRMLIDGLLVNGQDVGAAHRARCRMLTAAAQAREGHVARQMPQDVPEPADSDILPLEALGA